MWWANRLSARRLVGAVLADHDEWAEARRYLTIPNVPEPNMLDAAAWDDALLHLLTGHYRRAANMGG